MTLYALGPRRPRLHPQSWVAENATVIGDVSLSEDASVWFGSVLRGDLEPIVIGRGTNVQDGSVLHTDLGAPLTLGDQVTVGHQAMLHGCNVGDGSLIGIQAVVLNHAKIGRECLIGAKSLIPEGQEIPDRSLVLGTPGRVVRSLTEEEVIKLRENAMRYVENWRRYVAQLVKL
jgi:carbonic anhydrase/acetyltransferase-like protein (isoleucine patch superfamily)